MDTIEKILPYKGKIERGGKEVRIIAEDLRKERSIEESEQLAQALFAHSEVGVKMVGVFLFGILASQKDGILLFLKEKVGADKDWRVQEILAQALDRYCSNIGYKKALPPSKHG